MTLYLSRLDEGVNDKHIFKAVFLAGGPGSGKDFVMKHTVSGHGFKEINVDHATEYLFDKKGVSKVMTSNDPKDVHIRDIIRGRAKQIHKESERLALDGRLPLIINGTGDDVAQMRAAKQKLEELGYDTMMVFVNASDEISKQRNIDRGRLGGRQVPEHIRSQKWKDSQENIGAFQEIFGEDDFIVVDNSKSISGSISNNPDFLRVFKKTSSFLKRPLGSVAQKWIADQQTKRNLKSTAPKQEIHSQEVKSDASRLRLTYYGYGRYGKRLNGKNTVTHTVKNDKLVPFIHEANDMFESYLEGTPEIVNAFKMGTPGQSDLPKFKKKRLSKFKG